MCVMPLVFIYCSTNKNKWINKHPNMAYTTRIQSQTCVLIPMKIILKINKTNSDYYRSPYGIRISTAEADQTPGIVSPVGGRSRDRKVPSDHNAYTHTLMLDGRKFSKDSLHISFLCVSHKHAHIQFTYTMYCTFLISALH